MTNLHAEILKLLSARKDVWLDDAAAPEGAPTIRGVHLKRLQEISMVGADGYHPFTKREWVYVGQAFAIETDMQKGKGKEPFSKAQRDWRDAFESAGGLYIEARTMVDVYDHLGRHEPQPWWEYENREVRVGRVLNQQ